MGIWLIIALLGIVEGLTEFLPVSSTGHLILFGHLLGYTGKEADTFEIFIQSGAILAMVVVYFRQFFELLVVPADSSFHSRRGLLMLALTTLPALIAGALFHHKIKDHMTPLVVAAGLGVGAVWILIIEHCTQQPERKNLDDISWRTALGIGLFQCLALWPGMSRASSTILGGMMLGLKRRSATEYSFFAAVPVLCAACAYDLYKAIHAHELGNAAAPHLALGFIIAFCAALGAIKFFIHYVSRHTLAVFGWYRLVLVLVILIFRHRLGA